MPTAPEDPLAVRCRAGGLRNHRDDLIPGSRRVGLEVRELPPDLDQVPVALGQPGHGKAALEIDHLGRLADPAVDLAVAPERDDTIANDRERLDLGKPLVHRDDLPTTNHQIRGLPPPATAHQHHRAKRRKRQVLFMTTHQCNVRGQTLEMVDRGQTLNLDGGLRWSREATGGPPSKFKV